MTEQTLTAARVEAASLPVIDVADLSSSDPEKRAAVGRALRAACLDKGFFYCSGHGVPQGLIDAAFQETRALFDLPDAEKDLLDKSLSRCNRGYETLGGQTLEAGAMPTEKKATISASNCRKMIRALWKAVLIAGPISGPLIWPVSSRRCRPIMRRFRCWAKH